MVGDGLGDGQVSLQGQNDGHEDGRQDGDRLKLVPKMIFGMVAWLPLLIAGACLPKVCERVWMPWRDGSKVLSDSLHGGAEDEDVVKDGEEDEDLVEDGVESLGHEHRDGQAVAQDANERQDDLEVRVRVSTYVCKTRMYYHSSKSCLILLDQQLFLSLDLATLISSSYPGLPLKWKCGMMLSCR